MLAALRAASLLLCGLGGRAVARRNHRRGRRQADRASGDRRRRAEAECSIRAGPATLRVPRRRRETPAAPPQTEAQVVAGKNDEIRRGPPQSSSRRPAPARYEFNQQAIEALPQGTNTTLDKVLLQAPGVSQDSAASGELHVRNEHANLQYRINGIMLPDGVGAFGQIIDTGIVGSLALITGALPAQYGLRTAGVLDIQTKADAFNNSGSVSVYGGSHGTITTVAANMAARSDRPSISSPGAISAAISDSKIRPRRYNAIHDNTSQEKGFLYLSTVLDPTSRLTFMSGVSNGNYQIPNNPGQTPALHRLRRVEFQLGAAQRAAERVQPVQRAGLPEIRSTASTSSSPISTATASCTSCPIRSAIWSSTAWRPTSTARVSSTASRRIPPIASASPIRSSSDFRPAPSIRWSTTDRHGAAARRAMGNPVDAPFSVFDSSAKTGWLFSTYLEDEWKITNNLTLNAGLRFDQMCAICRRQPAQPAHQPDLEAVLTAPRSMPATARNFTPPEQVLAAPTNLALVQNTTAQPAVVSRTIRCCRSAPTCSMSASFRRSMRYPASRSGIDAYYKTARDLLDDGQFGAGLCADGVQLRPRRRTTASNSRRPTPTAISAPTATSPGPGRSPPTSCRTSICSIPHELAYIANHYVYTDHAQLLTASAGASYLWNGTQFSASMIYGSGLRDGFANTGTVPSYTQVNLGLSHDFNIVSATKPTTLRFDIVNLFDTIYEIRDGSGIGVFAPQFGPRRGFYFGISQKL